MAGKIFISYRRADSKYQAQRIYEAFLRKLPRETIFMDVDAIRLGRTSLRSWKVGWSSVTYCLFSWERVGPIYYLRTGKRRLDDQKISCASKYAAR